MCKSDLNKKCKPDYERLCPFQWAEIMKSCTLSNGANGEKVCLLPKGIHDEEV